MADIVKINSKKGLVKFSSEDLYEFDLLRWIRTTSNDALGRKYFIDDVPFERKAAELFHEKFPSDSVKIGKSIYFPNENTVETLLNITAAFSEEYYSSHPTELVRRKQPKSKVSEPEATDAIAKEASSVNPDPNKYYDVVLLKNASEFTDFPGGVDAFFQSPEDVMFDYLMKWYNPKTASTAYKQGVPWKSDDKVSFFPLENKDAFILVYNPESKYAALLYKEIDDNITSDESVSNDFIPDAEEQGFEKTKYQF